MKLAKNKLWATLGHTNVLDGKLTHFCKSRIRVQSVNRDELAANIMFYS